jgi:hypothetical protein
MHKRAFIDWDWIRQEYTSTVCGIPIPPRNTSQPREQGCLEGVLKQYREIELFSPKLAGQTPLARQSGVTTLIVVEQNPIDGGMSDP